jgi:ribonuclease E
MANKMLIDASHPEETRVVVLRGNRVEEFDFESASKKQLRGNIYLAKVTRVEPSLQAAFVDYGGNRHGFLAFSEIHPDYYQIPVADRLALLEEESRAHAEEEDEERGQRRTRRNRGRDRDRSAGKRANFADESVSGKVEISEGGAAKPFGARPATGLPLAIEPHWVEPAAQAPASAESVAQDVEETAKPEPIEAAADQPAEESVAAVVDHTLAVDAEGFAVVEEHDSDAGDEAARDDGRRRPHDAAESDEDEAEDEEDHVEQIGGDAMDETPYRAPRLRKQYKIQEVIKRRQVLLVQVVKEERGNKGAALTTYLSLAGRYSVLMPNTARGGGISRKITDAGDRKRLKSIAQELEVPEGMGVILRTAGASRTKPEVKRDFEYLLRMWETVRELTLQSTAPSLVYEEGSLIKRAIRDLYNKDIDEVVVSGDGGYREAKEFMRMLMPSHARNVQPWREAQPIFAKSGAEAQLDAMFSNQVTLKSGGYIVINQTEALVAIDVNSGRSTREHNIEDTALRTNLEAADEVARQLRLRDLAGLIVVDFIDMEENRNNRAVERRMKEALKNDRARIQIGRISHFGLLEMSRQRIRTGVLEGSTVVCPHCVGAGMVRSTSSIALHVLRVLEDALIRNAAHNITVRTRTAVALYILNQKRNNLRDLEARFGVVITVAADDTLTGSTYHAMERGELASGPVEPLARDMVRVDSIRPMDIQMDEDEEVEEEEVESEDAEVADETEAESEARRKRRRRRRRGRGADREGNFAQADAPQPSDDGLAFVAEIGGDLSTPVTEGEDDDSAENGEGNGEGRRRRRSRRGGRRNRAMGDQPMDETAPVEMTAQDEAIVHDVESEHPVESGEPTPEIDGGWVATLPPAPVEIPAEAVIAPAQDERVEIVVAEPVAPPPERIEMPEAPVDPDRPKRSGWWQRAKTTFGG